MKKKNTRQTLLMSVLSLLLCIVMLIGTTFAWFTDNVTSSGNIIKSGKLDVEMYWSEGNEDPTSTQWKNAAEGAIFNNDLWEPGYVEAKHIKITNEGTLAFMYKLHIVPNGTVEELADVIDVYYIEGATQITRADLTNATPVGTLRDMISETDGAAHGALLPVGTSVTNSYERVGEVTATIAFKMRESAGNEYQNKSIGSDFAIQLLATQYTYENDSFDNQYDKDSVYTSLYVELPEQPADVQIPLQGESYVKVTIPEGMVDELSNTVTAVAVKHTQPVVDSVDKTITFNMIDVVDQNGQVIDFEALNSNEKLTVTILEQDTFAAGELVCIYHDGEYVDMATVEDDGSISYKTSHFCEVVVSKEFTGQNINVSTGDEFKTICQLNLSGKMITLLSDITLDEELELPAGVILNGNGKQINGSVYAGGNLTIVGHTKVTAFSASYYNRTITIGEGACLEVTGGGRVSLAYGNVFNITGTISDAKSVNKENVQPSLVIPAGISITGGSDATINVANAYVKIGGTTSKPGAANGTFTLNFENSIAEFTKEFGFYEPTGGKNPTFNLTIKDSVFTTGTKLCVAAPNSNVVIDNSTVKLGNYIRNSGTITLKNNSSLTGSTIQFGENGGNNGTIFVDNSTLVINASSTGHALDGKNTGKVILKNNANASVTYYKDMAVECDSTSTFTGTNISN